MREIMSQQERRRKQIDPAPRAAADGHIYDDLHLVKLSTKTVKEPPVELWPAVVRRIALPPDVEERVAGIEQRDWLSVLIKASWISGE